MTETRISGSLPEGIDHLPEAGFDQSATLGHEPLPDGVYAARAADSVIPEIKAYFDPKSELFGFTPLQEARGNTWLRATDARREELETRKAAGEDVSEELAALTHESYHDPSQVEQPDADLLQDAIRKRDELIAALRGHAEVYPVRYLGGRATFVAVTPEKDLIYGIGPEDVVRAYLESAGLFVDSEYVDGKPDGTRIRRPPIPNPFDWYPNYSEQYPGPLDGGLYYDLVQKPDMLFEPAE